MTHEGCESVREIVVFELRFEFGIAVSSSEKGTVLNAPQIDNHTSESPEAAKVGVVKIDITNKNLLCRNLCVNFISEDRNSVKQVKEEQPKGKKK